MDRHEIDSIVCLNLRRRPDRWRRFLESLPKDWPFRLPIRFDAVDGLLCPPPSHWVHGPGAWGCLRSHLSVLEQSLNSGNRNVMVLEDDVEFSSGFSSEITTVLNAVRDECGMLYLGGDLQVGGGIAGPLVRAIRVMRTHAYIIRGETMEMVYRHLCNNLTSPVDVSLADLTESLARSSWSRQHAYACHPEMLVHQRNGVSDIS